MKVQIKENAETIWEFPCWGKRGELVVRFYKNSKGVVEVPDKNNPYGFHSETWFMSKFIPCENPFAEPKEEKKEISFPRLMISENGYIVQFLLKNCGVLQTKIGTDIKPFYDVNWDMDSFKPFNGEIILSNGN